MMYKVNERHDQLHTVCHKISLLIRYRFVIVECKTDKLISFFVPYFKIFQRISGYAQVIICGP